MVVVGAAHPQSTLTVSGFAQGFCTTYVLNPVMLSQCIGE